MRKNNVPRADRLTRRIENLEIRLLVYEPRPYGGGNPYHYCGGCRRSMIEVSYAGHYKNCPVVGIENEIAYYSRLLREDRKLNP